MPMIEFQMGRGQLEKSVEKTEEIKQAAEDALKEATFYTQSVIVKDFMSVVDNGQGKRSFSPGVRTITGNLKRSILRGVRFRKDPHGDMEGAIGTDVRYGEVLEEKTVYKFLKPGLDKAKQEFEKIFHRAIQARMRGR